MPALTTGLWREFSICKGQGDLFFPEQSQTAQAERAKRICRGCPVAELCLLEALVNNEDQGIRGGCGSDQWRRLRRNYVGFTTIHSGGAARVMREIVQPVVEAMRQGEVHVMIRDRNSPGATCGHKSTSNRGCPNPRPDGSACVACSSAVVTSGLRRKDAQIRAAAENLTPDEWADLLAKATAVVSS